MEGEIEKNNCTPAIATRNLSKSFGSQSVLEGINLEIGRGEFLVALGPSGSGKTTLLRIIAGLDQPDTGEVELNGRICTNLPPQERQLGVVFQEHALFQRMTVEENIGFGLKVRKMDPKEILKTVDEMLEIVRLIEHRYKYPSQLSGGQKQRVAVARALAFRPQVMLLDEPFSALDAVTRTELRREVRSLLTRMNIGALFITHDQEEALELADRIAVLNRGRLEQVGTPFHVYNQPKSEFVATFLGAANVLLGRWCDGQVIIGNHRLTPPAESPVFSERQVLKVVFRPEDVSLNFQTQFLETPYYLGRGVVEEVSYVGAMERLVVRLPLWSVQNSSCGAALEALDMPGLEETVSEGFPLTISRTKWEASDMELSSGDAVVIGLKDFRLLGHYPVNTGGDTR